MTKPRGVLKSCQFFFFFNLKYLLIYFSEFFFFCLFRIPTSVPAVCVQFPHELTALALPEFILKDKYHNLIDLVEMPVGGHFPAFEEPKLLADNIYESVKKMRKIKQAK